MDLKRGRIMYYIKIEIKWGNIVCRIEEDGAISGLWFEGQKYYPEIPEDAIWLSSTSKVNDTIDASVGRLISQIKSYEKGELKEFDLVLTFKGTDFQTRVWDILLKIPCGKTSTYGDIGKEIAKQLGKKSMSAQAVGGAVGHNPISIIVPCHRVLGAKGQLTGYAGGIDKKIGLLRHEGVEIDV
jgi:methylated-DNA-[protein]-cysteine S-methyltransferase